jgi:hypothetical protein
MCKSPYPPFLLLRWSITNTFLPRMARNCYCTDLNSQVVKIIGISHWLPILISFSLDIHPVVELLDHIGVLFLIIWGSHMFSTRAVLTCIPTNSVQEFPFLQGRKYLLSLFFVLVDVISGIRWYFVVILTCSSLVISGVEYFLQIHHRHLCVFLLLKCNNLGDEIFSLLGVSF